jgi:5-methylcytosine-specific restriction enzyme A
MPPRNLAPAQTLHWRSWYSLQSWRTRAKHQLRLEPLCALCAEQGRVVPATIADHHPGHGGDWNKFRLGPLQSLCRDCHKRKWADDAHGYRCAIGDDGSTPAIRSTGETKMDIAEFRTELDRLIKKFSRAGLSSEDIADELDDASDDLRRGEKETPDEEESD